MLKLIFKNYYFDIFSSKRYFENNHRYNTKQVLMTFKIECKGCNTCWFYKSKLKSVRHNPSFKLLIELVNLNKLKQYYFLKN